MCQVGDVPLWNLS